MPRGPYVRRQAANAAPEANASTPIQQPVSSRAAETRRERRRRDDGDLDGMAHLKLTIPPKIKDQMAREGKVVRFFLEGNVPAAYQNDWDPVEGVDQILANPKAGERDRLILCSKFKDWHDADQARQDEVLNEREHAMMAGSVNGDGGSSAGLEVPKGQINRVSRQRGL